MCLQTVSAKTAFRYTGLAKNCVVYRFSFISLSRETAVLQKGVIVSP